MVVDILKISQSRIDGNITHEIIESKEVDEEAYLKPLLKLIVRSVANGE